MQLRVAWNTSGPGHDRFGLAERETFVPEGRSGEKELSITLPEEPYSFSGGVLLIIWAFELIEFPSRESTRVVFVMGPGGKEVIADSLKKEWAARRES